MKKLLLFGAIAISINAFGQNINIPDTLFKSYLVGDSKINTNGDGEIQVSEATSFSGGIECENADISDLTGIEMFTALTILNCDWNQLTSLDISQNKSLTDLWCHGNQLTYLDVSQNTALTELECTNNQLTSLNVSQNIALKNFYCGWNQLTSLDLSHNTVLKGFSCGGNQLTSLDLSHNTALTILNCEDNQLTSLNVNGAISLVLFYCPNNKLTSLDLSQNTALTALGCEDNQLTSLNVNGAISLVSLNCPNNKLTSLDLSQNTALTELECTNNQLTSLNINGAISLVRLRCGDNQLTSLDVSHNSALTYLNCSENKLTSIDLTNNNKLTSLDSTGYYGKVLLLEGNLFLPNSELLALEGFNDYIKAISEYFDGEYELAIEGFNNSILFDFQEVDSIDVDGGINPLYKPVRDLQRQETIAFYYRANSKLKLKKYEEAIMDYNIVISRNDSLNYFQGHTVGYQTGEEQPHQDAAYYGRGLAKKNLKLPYEIDFYKSCEMGYKLACYKDSSKENKIKLPEADDFLKISFTNQIFEAENLIFDEIPYHFSYYLEIKASSITSKYEIVRFTIKNTCLTPNFVTKYYNGKYMHQSVKNENSISITLLNFNKIDYIQIYENECGIDNMDLIIEFFNK